MKFKVSEKKWNVARSNRLFEIKIFKNLKTETKKLASKSEKLEINSNFKYNITVFNTIETSYFCYRYNLSNRKQRNESRCRWIKENNSDRINGYD